MAGRVSSKAAHFVGLVRHEFRRLQSSPLESKALDKGISGILKSNPTALSIFKSGPNFGKGLGAGNIVNNFSPGQNVVSQMAMKFGQIATKSGQGERRILTRRELQPEFRSTNGVGMQRLPSECRRHTFLKQEFGVLRGGEVQGRRGYYVDRSGMQHFKRRGPSSWTEKFVSQRSMVVLVLLGGGGVVVYYRNQQTIPYTHRKHLVLVSPKMERSIGDHTFEMMMKEYKGRVLPANHPESLRVHKIANQVIDALLLEVKASDWGQLERGSEAVTDYTKEWNKDPDERNLERSLLDPHVGHTHSAEDEFLDDTWVQKSRIEGLQAGNEGYTKHLEGMKWKVVVVDDDIVNAVCIPGGKIVVFTGLLKKFRADSDVATVLAHEIGHAVARHSAESLTNNLFIVVLQLAVLSVFYVPGLVNSISELVLRLPFSRRMEIEADHIGLLLMAAAGFDPRVAPGLYEKLGKLDSQPEYTQYMSTHPSGKKRGEMLRQTATMEEAMRLYQQKMSGHGTEGFF